jgi:hypothetical protein
VPDLLTTAYNVARAGTDLHLQIKIELWLAELHLARHERDLAAEALAHAKIRLVGSKRQGLQDRARRVRAALQDVPADLVVA